MSNNLVQTEHQLTKEEATKLYESNFWEGMEPFDIALFQMFQDRLCLPFDVFHKAVEEALGRPVWTHEFAGRDGLKEELLGLRPAPSMQEIINLIPEEKRILIEL